MITVLTTFSNTCAAGVKNIQKNARLPSVSFAEPLQSPRFLNEKRGLNYIP
jgi:hypothetical protein